MASPLRALRMPQESAPRLVEFLAGELARPLQAAERNLERAIAGDPASARQALSDVRRASRMIRDLEQYSLIDVRSLELHLRSVDLKGLIREVSRELDLSEPGRSIQVVERGGIGTVRADPVRVSQVASDLIANALDFGEAGSPVRVEIEYGPAEATVSVINRGEGIAQERLPHIFDTRLDPRDPRGPAGKPGLGLGLFVTRAIVEAHGGRIWAESEPGRETAFRFTLPR